MHTQQSSIINASLRPLAIAVALAGLCGLSGCRNCDLVEAELRSRETELRELHDELGRRAAYNDALQRELQAVRRPSASAKLSPERASQIYALKEIALGRQTGGYDGDGSNGDEALQIVLEPRDPDGHAIKAPGSLHIDAFEVTTEGLKLPLSSWDLPPDNLRRTWRSGLLSTGYYVVLPWKNRPTSTKLRVVVRFMLADGRSFEADKDVTIRLEASGKTSTPVQVTPLQDPPAPAWPESESLPAPRKTSPVMPPAVDSRGREGTQKREPVQPASLRSDTIQFRQPIPIRDSGARK